MYVKCINVKHIQGFTQGKVYRVEKIRYDQYLITCDRGHCVYANKRNFTKMKPLKQFLYRLFKG